MLVLEVGTDIINDKESHYIAGGLLEGNKPKTGELLDFVRVTSLTDKARGGALYLTASDSESPYMDVIDGLGFEHSLIQISESQRTNDRFCFPVSGTVNNLKMLIMAFRMRASVESSATLAIGYSDEIDGIDTIQLITEWHYKLSTVTIDYPEQYQRDLIIPFDADWFEIEQLNVVKLSSISILARLQRLI